MGTDKIKSGSFLVSVVNDDWTYTPIGTIDSLESVDISDSEKEKFANAFLDPGSDFQSITIKVKPGLKTKLFFLKMRIRHWLWQRQLKDFWFKGEK